MLRTLVAAATLFVMTANAENRVFEMRTYTTHEGKLEALLARFRNHTTKLFERHGMTNIGYWVPKDKPNTLVYILAHESVDAAKMSFDNFRKDPEWVKARDASEAAGKIVVKVDSVFMDPTDFSKLK
ncbi:MAG TPA: NIPSNAP family protein [Bryobacteraceae bacterium]|nr:NIPSNAP family protein [Bryobacteraceae bacterium]